MKTALAHLRTLLIGLTFGGVVAFTVVLILAAFVSSRRKPAVPDPPSLVERIREVARLETLDVSLYKKVAFQPDPKPSDSMLGELATWATYSVNPPEGRAIVFADAHLAFDFGKIDARSIRARGDMVEMVLPPMTTTVEIRPAETEIVRSNLNSANTALLLDRARWEMQADVERDTGLHLKARASAERSLRALFLGAGFREVRFVEQLGALPAA